MCITILDFFVTFLDILRHNRGQLAKFWVSYIDMIDILLGLLRADREGNWFLHLACIRKVIPWCLALGKVNYSRYLPVYYAQRMELESSCPELYQHFRKGYFYVQIGKHNPFGRIAVDQTIEETVNKDTQTSGGTRGFSLRPGAVSRYYCTAEYRASAMRQLHEAICVQNSSKFSHHDLGSTHIQKDESSVEAINDLLEKDWINPFDKNPSDLFNISTGTGTTPEVSNDL